VVERLKLWERLKSAPYGWLRVMVRVWLLATVIVFVARPLVLRRRFLQTRGGVQPVASVWLHRTCWVLLVLSLIAVFGVIADSQG
jgi:hypothetical protein